MEASTQERGAAVAQPAQKSEVEQLREQLAEAKRQIDTFRRAGQATTPAAQGQAEQQIEIARRQVDAAEAKARSFETGHATLRQEIQARDEQIARLTEGRENLAVMADAMLGFAQRLKAHVESIGGAMNDRSKSAGSPPASGQESVVGRGMQPARPGEPEPHTDMSSQNIVGKTDTSQPTTQPTTQPSTSQPASSPSTGSPSRTTTQPGQGGSSGGSSGGSGSGAAGR
jgi:hypothetical protein